MSSASSTSFLRTLVLVDAFGCAAMGAVLVLAASTLAALTAIPEGLLFYAGVVLFPVAAFMFTVSRFEQPPRPAAWLIIAGNVLWVIASGWLMAGSWIGPNALGHAFVAAQALAVAALAALEYLALRRAALAAAA